MTTARWSLVAAAIAGIAVVGACGADSAAPAGGGLDAGDDGADAGLGDDANAGDDGAAVAADVDAAPAQPRVRIANLSPDAPSIDICLALQGTGVYQGPLFAGFLQDAGATVSGLPFTQVSGYLAVAPGTYSVRLVAGGAASCDLLATPDAGVAEGGGDAGAGDGASDGGEGDLDAAIEGGSTVVGGPEGGPPGTTTFPFDFTTTIQLLAGTNASLLVTGDFSPVEGDSPLQVAVLLDDIVPASGAASLRALDAVPSSVAANLGFGQLDAGLTPVLDSVAFGKAAGVTGPGAGTPDPNFYLPIAPVTQQSVVVTFDPPGVVPTASGHLDLKDGTTVTVFAVGGKTGIAPGPMLEECVDSTAGGVLAACTVVE